MKKNLRKHAFRDIKNSFGRFMSILLIASLGVAFFTGVTSSPQAMTDTADYYYDQYELMDLRLVSTLGLTVDDVIALKELSGVKGVYPTYSQDVLMNDGETELVLKIHALPDKIDEKDENYLNRPHLVEGRLPEKQNEVVIENDSYLDHLEIGSTIKLTSGTDKSLEETLEHTEYTIVGRVETPYYLTYDKGTSAIGSGSVNSFIMMPQSNFKLEAYTDIYVTAEGAKELQTYGKDYDELMEPLIEEIESVGLVQAQRRYDDIKSEALATLDEKTKEYEDGKKQAETELDAAEADIKEGKQALVNGQNELDKQKSSFDSYIAGVKADLDSKKQELSEGEKAAKQAYDEFMKNKPAIEAELDKLDQSIVEGEAQLVTLNEQLEGIKLALQNPELTPEEKLALEGQLATGQKTYDVMAEGLVLAKEKATQGRTDLVNGETQLVEAMDAIEAGKVALAEGETQLETETQKAGQSFASAQAEINSGFEELADGEVEFKKQKAEVEAELADAKEQLDDAKAQINELEVPEWFVLDRNKHYSYVDYENAALSIEAISKVFPIFFFAVAALVCLTTMTRMVDENRLNIGTLKGLGYSNFSIASKFLIYAGLASIIGGILGSFIGFNVFPNVILDAYSMLYVLPYKVVNIDFGLAIIAILVAMAVTMSSAYLAVNKELLETPSLLMRPKAPKSGKRILIERVPFIWNNLSFIGKVTVRNIFRYKKRFFMTVIGISGCTALLLAGFGIKDSIRTISDKQFGELYLYDVSIGLAKDISDDNKEALVNYLSTDETVSAYGFMGGGNGKLVVGDSEQNVSLFIPENMDELNELIVLRDRLTETPLSLSDEGVILNEKVASLLGIKAGDTVELVHDDKTVEVKVTALTEQYVNHYVYMSPAYYEQLFGESVSYNSLVVDLSSIETEDVLASELMAFDDVNSVMLISSFKDNFNDTISSLNYVVLLMIISAGALAFVVLYNLTNVNISERMREIATIKVLGFYDKEVSSYIYRENIILTLIGTIVGLGLGVLLHRFIMVTVELDNMMFGREVDPMSFVYSGALTLVFAFLVNLAMAPKLKNVKMVESLKSVD